MNDTILNFDGPFTFTDGKDSVFLSRHVKSAGIYLWTHRQKNDGTHMIHYVGEATRFGKRHREQLINILGLNYGIFNSEKTQQGVSELLWRGLWRYNTEDAPCKTISEYRRINAQVVSYVESLCIFFAELNIDGKIRKHIEGCIGWNLRNNHPECRQLYPDDNYVGAMKDKNHVQLIITAPEVIRGLDASIPY